ncbi:hypothetical protein CRG98_043777 [Punica granatum]|uniref:Chalcone/stilbene synthase N-terminal domain-containing protein n=1 Tax=Punica granatum TaxID=22663 RepID=A0A2I0HVW2_PUNGR|nr:hypothetical protein CRG98_043777 [Punica granatum]
MVTAIGEMRANQRAKGHASILAIGTATPESCFHQADFPDYYFRVTKSEHMTDLKQKFTRICDRSTVKKRYMIFTEEFLRENPMFCSHNVPSLNARQDTLMDYIPKLAAKAASKAIMEWGQPKSMITHVIVCTVIASEMPGVDVKLIKLLGLNPSVKRIMLYHQGCFAGGTVLRIAKDLLAASRHVLQEYGNMSSACVLFILDEMRRRSKEDRMLTTGEGLEWGVLFGFGPGLTVETVVLRSCPIV